MHATKILSNFDYIKPIGVYKKDHSYGLFYLLRKKTFSLLESISTDGFNFNENRNEISIKDINGDEINYQNLSSIRTSFFKNREFCFYRLADGKVFVGEKEKDSYRTIAEIPQINEYGQIISDFKFEDNFIAYVGGSNIRILISKDLKTWKYYRYGVIKNRDKARYEIGLTLKTNSGIAVIYFKKKKTYSMEALIFDQNLPGKIIYKSNDKIWTAPKEWNQYGQNIIPAGIVIKDGSLISYWNLNNKEILAVFHAPKLIRQEKKQFPLITLKKIKENPILKPLTEHFWESKAVFNPAAIYEGGKIHLIYRAIGDSDVSTLGYATTRDGINIDERLNDPIFIPTNLVNTQNRKRLQKTNIVQNFTSGGGGYGGAEDPRLTKIGKRLYMTYVNYDGWSHPRVALTSISTEDFVNRHWNWDEPVLISPPGVVDKNAVIFPEKINGKYVIMHRIFPNILIDFVDNLDFDGNTYLKGEYKISPRAKFWDSRKIGAGPPPIKTKDGWLLIYHAVDDKDPGRYKMGAMLLDLNDPTKVLARNYKPILEPIESYENEGMKYGVAYPCGAVAMKDYLYVYYGGADMVTCCAKAYLPNFLDDLKKHNEGAINLI